MPHPVSEPDHAAMWSEPEHGALRTLATRVFPVPFDTQLPGPSHPGSSLDSLSVRALSQVPTVPRFRRRHDSRTGPTASLRRRVGTRPKKGSDRAFPQVRTPSERGTPDRIRTGATALRGHCVSTASVQVIPEGAGPVKSVGRPVFLSSTRCAGAPMRRRGPGSGGARPRSGRRALTPSPFGACCSGCRGRAGGLLLEWFVGLVDVARISAGVSGGSRRLAARSSLRRAQRWWSLAGRHDGVRQSGRSGQSEGSTSPR